MQRRDLLRTGALAGNGPRRVIPTPEVEPSAGSVSGPRSGCSATGEMRRLRTFPPSPGNEEVRPRRPFSLFGGCGPLRVGLEP